MFILVPRKRQSASESFFQILMLVVGVFFLSLVMSCQELRYMVSGKVVETSVGLRDEMRVNSDGSKTQIRVMTYRYRDGTEDRGQSIEVPSGVQLTDNQMVKIQYIPGRDTSRLLGQTNMFWVCIFFGSLVVAVVGFILLGKFG